MMLEFRRAALPEEAGELWRLDVEIFGKDAFAPEDWLSLESYWIVVDGRVAGARRLFVTWSFRRICAGTGKTRLNRVRSIFRVRGYCGSIGGAGWENGSRSGRLRTPGGMDSGGL